MYKTSKNILKNNLKQKIYSNFSKTWLNLVSNHTSGSRIKRD